MTSTIPTLSDEVMEALRPVMEAVGLRAREAARRTMHRRAERAGLAAVRALGYHATHENGHDAIMQAVFGDLRASARGEGGLRRGYPIEATDINIDLLAEDALPAPVTVTPPAPVLTRNDIGNDDDDDDDDDEDEMERTCECYGCDDPTCQGECDWCDDGDCRQCHGDHDDGEHWDCATCHDVFTCCAYCEKCDEHHPDAVEYMNGQCGDCNHCRECDHYC